MVLQKFIMTSFQKKAVFDSVLSDELKDCKHRIVVRYEWERPDQVLEIFASNNGSIELGINLNTDSNKYFCKLSEGTEFQIIYRAYFISAYIHCLDDAITSVPQTYFSGLVLLCAINDLCSGKRVNAFSPTAREPHELRPIDIYCSVRALTKLTTDHADKRTEHSREYFKQLIGELLMYSMLPEISYKGGEIIYSLLQEIGELRENMISHRCVVSDYVLFNKFVSDWFDSFSINDLAAMCEDNQDYFWGNVAIRLSAHLYERVNNQESLIESCVQNFKEDSVRYFMNTRKTENLLLLDNLIAIKKLSLKIENAFSTVAANSGSIHFFQ